MKDYLTVKEAADLFDRNSYTVYRWIQKRKLEVDHLPSGQIQIPLAKNPWLKAKADKKRRADKRRVEAKHKPDM